MSYTALVKKAALLATAILLTTATLLLAGLWLNRLSPPYKEEGRYFDPVDSVVYDTNAVLTYGVLTVLFAFPAALTLFWALRTWRK